MARKKGEYPVTTRRIRLFELLRGRRFPVPLAELAAEFGVHEDTTRRDLRYLENAGYAIDYTRDDDHDGRTLVKLRNASFVDIDVPISREEAHTFAGTRRLMEPLRGTPFYDNFESLYRKIVETLPAKERADIERDRTRFFCIPDGGVLPYEDKHTIVETLRLASMSRRRVEYVYRTRAGKYRSGILEPFAVGVYKNTIYLLARLVPSQRSATTGTTPHLSWVSWPAHRFKLAALTREEFKVPDDFKLEDHFDGWGIISGDVRERVVVEFDAELAPLITERRWHPSQALEPLPDGGVRLACDIANTSEVIAWILSFGSHAIVIEPASLREQVLMEHTRAVERTLARLPPNPSAPKGWQDEGQEAIEEEAMQGVTSKVSNDNEGPTSQHEQPASSGDGESDQEHRNPSLGDLDDISDTDPLNSGNTSNGARWRRGRS